RHVAARVENGAYASARGRRRPGGNGAHGRRAEAAPREPGPRPEHHERDHGHGEPAPTRTRRPAVAVDTELSQELGGVHRVLSIHWHLVQCATAGDASAAHAPTFRINIVA